MIAKYRLGGFPGGWYLTDFTMEQVEGRIADLEAREARLEEALRGIRDAKTYGECAVAVEKAREVLGDASA